MIEVRIGITDCLPLGRLEEKLVAAGVPGMPYRRGGLMQWFDPRTDEFVYEYYEPEEMLHALDNQSKPGADHE